MINFLQFASHHTKRHPDDVCSSKTKASCYKVPFCFLGHRHEKSICNFSENRTNAYYLPKKSKTKAMPLRYLMLFTEEQKKKINTFSTYYISKLTATSYDQDKTAKIERSKLS